MPNNKILLMTADYYKKNSVVNLNVESDINIHIVKAQNMHIERILGTNLFDTVLEQVRTGSVDSRIETLIRDYIQPALIEWTTYVALPYYNYKIANKGVVRKSSDNSESSELNELNFIRQDIRDDAEYLSERMTKFLDAKSDIYTEYDNGNDDCDDIRPSKTSFFSGIVLKNNDDCCDDDYR